MSRRVITYQAFPEWDQCECGCKPTRGRVSLFRVTKKAFKICPDDGMPDAQWVWTCNFQLLADATVLIKAAYRRPPDGSLESLMILARSLRQKWLTWQRLKNGKLVERTFAVYPATSLSEIENPESKIANP